MPRRQCCEPGDLWVEVASVSLARRLSDVVGRPCGEGVGHGLADGSRAALPVRKKYAPNQDLEADAIGCGHDRKLSISVNVRKSPIPRCWEVPREGGGVQNPCAAPTPVLETRTFKG